MRKLVISSVLAASLLTTAGLARLATDGTGQFLVAPAYFANGGFSTKLKLVNTNLTHSVIYRAVVREFEASQEIDFFITLSPSDVWEGRLYQGPDGKSYIQSEDPSTYRNSLSVPVDLAGNNLAANKTPRTFEKGYVEFYPVAMFNEGLDRIVPKSILYDRVDEIIAGNDEGIDQAIPGFVPAEGWKAKVVGNNITAGFVTIESKAQKAAMTLPMTAFEDVAVGAVPTGPSISYQADTDPALYVEEEPIWVDLLVQAATVTFEGKGVNDGVYFTFWNDMTGANKAGCTQRRSFNAISRDMEENRFAGTTHLISPAPASAVNNIRCEFGGVQVNKILELTGGLSFDKGMIQLNNFNQDADTSKQMEPGFPSAIITNMSAVLVDGQYSYSWINAPVLRYERIL